MSNPTMTNYTNCLTLEQMEYLDLFDNIPYKVVKKLVKLHDETDFEVEIEDIPIDGCCMCSTSFTFKLEIDISKGSLPLMVEKEYCVIKEYNGSSPMAMYIGENLVYPESEEEEQDERYCDNDDCPYGGFCCFEVLEEHKGKPYICEGCSTGIGLQEQEEKEKQLNAVKTIIKYVYRYVLGYHEDEDGYGRCDCGGGYNTCTSCFWHYEEYEYACLKCRDLAEEGNRHDICTDCYNRECECESEEEEEE